MSNKILLTEVLIVLLQLLLWLLAAWCYSEDHFSRRGKRPESNWISLFL